MNRIRRSAVLLGLVASVIVGSSIPASATFTEAVSTNTLALRTITVAAPACAAPCSAFAPIPPMPITITVSPGSMPADLTAEPHPVGTAHPNSAAAFNGCLCRS